MATTFKNAGASLTTGGGITSLYTVPASTIATALSLTIANTHSAQIQVSVSLFRSGSTQFYVCFQTAVPQNGTFVAIGDGQKLTLQAGDILKVQTYTGPCDAVLSFVEVA